MAIGLAVGIGAHWGRRIAIWFGFCLLIATPLKAQVYYGDTSITKVGTEGRGYFYLDTLEYIGHKRVDKKKPWVYQIRPPLFYWDLWMRTADCQGFTSNFGEFSKFRWFIVNAESFGTDSPAKLGYAGYTLIDSMAIYVSAKERDSPETLMHEVTHALMWLNGEGIRHTFRRFGPFGCALNYVDYEHGDPELMPRVKHK